MGSFKLGKMTLRSLFSRPETVRYPFEEKPKPQGLRGHIEVDMKECILCGVCEKRCPTGCITVNKPDQTWTINTYSCIQCDTCVRECPKHCISVAPEFPKPHAEKSLTMFAKPEPTPEELAEAARKEAEKADRIRKAKEAKAAREAAKKAAAEGESADGE